jgi:hypothetical protein
MGRILGERGVIQAIAAIMMLAIIGSAAVLWSDNLKDVGNCTARFVERSRTRERQRTASSHNSQQCWK